MYRYDEFDLAFVQQRVKQFRGQVERRLAGELSEDEFKPLRLMNGLYLQLHAYMLRVAVPYGTLSSRQLRKLAHIARAYDRGYGHFTTRQNIQFNWPKLVDVPDILEELASVEMHAIQTSGNCIRNVTADHFAGAAADEIEDPRIYAEIVRQWSSLHPEFSFLPRKFKIAITGAPNDRAAVRFHDIGLQMRRNEAGEAGFEVIVGGGLGRTPYIGVTIKKFLPKQDLLSYLENAQAIPVPIPHDCSDGFLGAYWRRPTAYLDATVRGGISSFATCRDLSPLRQLEDDLQTGRWHRRNARLLELDALDLGYRLLVGRPSTRRS